MKELNKKGVKWDPKAVDPTKDYIQKIWQRNKEDLLTAFRTKDYELHSPIQNETEYFKRFESKVKAEMTNSRYIFHPNRQVAVEDAVKYVVHRDKSLTGVYGKEDYMKSLLFDAKIKYKFNPNSSIWKVFQTEVQKTTGKNGRFGNFEYDPDNWTVNRTLSDGKTTVYDYSINNGRTFRVIVSPSPYEISYMIV